MNEIFISHSKRDNSSISFFNKLFAATKVKAIYEEIDEISGLQVNQKKISNDIQNSSAFFILHDQKNESLAHTRDWITWESGTANGMNKEIWLFEKSTQAFNNKMVVPHINNLVVYDPDNDQWIPYLLPIINRFEEISRIATPAVTTAIGASVSENKFLGGLIGLGIGALLNSSNKVNAGEPFTCFNKCKSSFNIHIPPKQSFRCPICNEQYHKN